MTWTTAVPKVNGWYWVKNWYCEGSIDVFFISYHEDTDEVLVWKEYGEESLQDNERADELLFYGPMVVPE